MIGYTLETRRRVARSPRWRAMAPALTQEQQRALAPTIIVKRPAVADERQRRYDDPTIFDLADMAWHVREQRKRTETLRTPRPGSNLVVSGEVSMPWRQYVRAAASNQTPGPLRVAVSHALYEHTIAPCENHLMVPLGWQAMSRRELLATFTGHRHKYVTQTDHVHEVDVRPVDGDDDGKYQWRCRRCDEYGFEDYTQETLGRATGVVWHGCVRCMGADRAAMARRTFLKFGIAVAGGLSAFTSAFDPIRPVPFVPPAYGAPSTYFVDWVSGNDSTGTGATGAPWKKFEKARTQMVANNGDTVKGRGGNTAGQYYVEFFDTSHMFPSGSSFAVATTITKDTGHTPTIRPNAAIGTICDNIGASKQYVVFDGMTFDCVTGNGAGIGVRANPQTATGGSIAAHHFRVTGCEMFNLDSDSALVSMANGHHCEILSSTLHHTFATFNGVYTHALYFAGFDNLAQGVLASDVTGYLIHGYDGGQGGDSGASRCVTRRSRMTGSGRGIRIGSSTSALFYYLLIYDCTTGTGGAYINNATSAVFLNNTMAANFSGGITVTSAASGTKFRNNISDGNGGSGNFVNGGSGTDHTSGSTNSWNVGGWNSDFVLYASRNLHLGANSSAIGRATSITSDINTGTFPEASVTDFDGVSVPQNGTPDSGALEFVGAGAGSGTGLSNTDPFHRARIRH